jgi:hypothetical protein
MYKKVEGEQITSICLYSGRCTNGTEIILHPSQSSCRVKGMLCQENMEFWMRFSIRLGVGFQNDVTLFGTGWLHYFGHGIVQPLPAIIELPFPSALDFFFPSASSE